MKKKIPLKGKRVSVLKDIEGDIKNDFSLSKIQLTELEQQMIGGKAIIQHHIFQ